MSIEKQERCCERFSKLVDEIEESIAAQFKQQNRLCKIEDFARESYMSNKAIYNLVNSQSKGNPIGSVIGNILEEHEEILQFGSAHSENGLVEIGFLDNDVYRYLYFKNEWKIGEQKWRNA